MFDENFFSKGKSAVNFCEQDYIDIGEYYNVMTSFVIFFFGLYGFYKSKNINSNSNKKNIFILYILLSLIGLGSVYFHFDLSPFAHWIDIIFISMILIYSQYVLDIVYFYKNIDTLFCKIKYMLLFLFHILTSIYIPQIHIFILFGTGFIIKNSIENIIKKNIIEKTINSKIIIDNYYWTKKYFICAFIFWIIDYFCCGFIYPLHTHWIFHIFIGLTSFKIIELIKYID